MLGREGTIESLSKVILTIATPASFDVFLQTKTCCLPDHEVRQSVTPLCDCALRNRDAVMPCTLELVTIRARSLNI